MICVILIVSEMRTVQQVSVYNPFIFNVLLLLHSLFTIMLWFHTLFFYPTYINTFICVSVITWWASCMQYIGGGFSLRFLIVDIITWKISFLWTWGDVIYQNVSLSILMVLLLWWIICVLCFTDWLIQYVKWWYFLTIYLLMRQS